MSKINQIQALVSEGLYYLTDHADEEAAADGFDIHDVEQGIMTGKIRITWPREEKYEIIGYASDERAMGIVCRITTTRKVRVITIYEDKPRT